MPSEKKRAGRLTEAIIRQAIDKAEPELEWCLRVVARLGGHASDVDFATSVPAFQLRLLDAITALEDVYRSIKREERRLISRKARLNYDWFRRRMAKLAFYAKAIGGVLTMARAIGDGFAWFFYERHRDLIDEHLTHQRQPLLPAAIGALGERLTVKNLLVIDNKLLLYHGITTFLRIGDFTLIDLSTLEVSAIGELKTGRPASDHIQTNVSLVAAELGRLPRIPIAKSPSHERLVLPPAMAERRKRQLRAISNALAAVGNSRKEVAAAKLNDFHFDKLEDVARRCGHRKFMWIKADNGFIIGALRLKNRRKAPLSSILLDKGSDHASLAVSDAPEWARKIVSDEKRLNSLTISSPFSDERDYITRRTEYPVSLWPIAPAVLADILLHRVMIITFFNPAYLWKAIEEKGYELQFNRKGKVIGGKKTAGNRFSELQNLDYYAGMISSCFMTEKGVLGLIDQLIAVSEEKFDGRPTRVELNPRINRFPSLRRRKTRSSHA